MHRLVIALVTLIGLTGAAFVAGYLLLFSASTDRAAALAPADTRLLRQRLPPAVDRPADEPRRAHRPPAGLRRRRLARREDRPGRPEPARRRPGIDYREQIKPWLGNQIAIAGWPADGDLGEPAAVVIAEVKDRAAAEAAIAEPRRREGGEPSPRRRMQGVEIQVVGRTARTRFVGDMLVIGEAVDGVQAVVDVDGGGRALGAARDFRATMDGLPADHLASVFVDLAALAEADGRRPSELAGVSTAGAALVAERDGLRLSGSAPFDAGDAAATARAGFALGSEPSSLVDWMPDGHARRGRRLRAAPDARGRRGGGSSTPEGEEVSGMLDTIRALAAFGLGIDLDADVLPLLDREVGIAITGIRRHPAVRPAPAATRGPGCRGRGALDRLVDGLSSSRPALRADRDRRRHRRHRPRASPRSARSRTRSSTAS